MGIDLFLEEHRQEILSQPSPSRGYIHLCKDAFTDPEDPNRTYSLSFDVTSIPNSDFSKLNPDELEEKDGFMISFLMKNYPAYFVIPFLRVEHLSKEGIEDEAFKSTLINIAKRSGTIINRFYLADDKSRVLAIVKRGEQDQYAVDYVVPKKVKREKLRENFPEQYAALEKRLNDLDIKNLLGETQ